ncbi:MAG: DUF2100 domain-containing protein [Candidatus Freyrarchaeum guaymaensis]|nr:DUF2100 domain-containing protein [Candidatus Sigynarchaeota archaeon]
MNFGYEDIEGIRKAVDALITILCEIRSFAPGYELDSAAEERIRSLLRAVREALGGTMEKFGLQRLEEGGKSEVGRVDLSGILFVVVSSSARKRLLDLGVEPRFVVVTGGPLNAVDMKALNPGISDEALEMVGRKVESVWREIESRAAEAERIVVLVEEGSEGGVMVSERADEIQRRTGVQTSVKTFPSVRGLSLEFFEEFLGEEDV